MNRPALRLGLHIVAAILAVMVCAFGIVLGNETFQQYTARQIVRILSDKTGLDINFGRVIWYPLSGLEISGIAVYSNGKQALLARKVELSYSLSWKKPFITLKIIHIDSPLIVGDLDEKGQITNFPVISKTVTETRPSETSFNMPVPDVEVRNGRIVAIQDGYVKVAFKDVSARVRISIEPKEGGENVFRIRVFDGNIFAERPLLESFKWNGTITVSRDGVNIKNLSVFSGLWGVFTGSGFWDHQTQRGFFRFLLEGLDLSNVFFVPANVKKHFGIVSLNGEVTLAPSSADARYIVDDSRLGRIKGTIHALKLGDGAFRIDHRAYFRLSSSPTDVLPDRASSAGLYSFSVQGTVDSELNVFRSEDISGNVSLALGNSEFIEKSNRRFSIDRGFVKFNFQKGNLEIVKASFYGTSGQFNGHGSISLGKDLSVSENGNPIYKENAVKSFELSIPNWFFTFRTERLAEWNTFLKLPLDMDGLCQIEGSIIGSQKGTQIKLKSSVEKAHLDRLLLKRFSFESDGFLKVCRSSDLAGEKYESGCKGIKFGNAVYSLEQNARIAIEGLQTGDDKRIINGDVTIAQSGDKSKIAVNFRADDVSGSFNAFLDDIWKSPSFSLTKSYVSLPEIGRIDLALSGLLKQETVEVTNLVISKGDQSITGSFKIGKSERIEGRFRVNNINMADEIGKRAGVKVLGGALNGEVVIGGSLEVPVISARFGAQPGSILWKTTRSGSFKWNRFEIVAEIDRNNASAEAILESPGAKKPVEARVKLPVKLSFRPFEMMVYKDKPFSATASISELDLAYLIPWFMAVDVVKGTLNARVQFFGTLANIKSEGEAQIQKGELEIRKGYLVSGIDGVLRFEPRGVNIADIKAKVLQGNAVFNGFIPYENWRNLEISGDFQEVAMPRFYGITAKGSGKARLIFRQGYPFIEGNFRIIEANMDLGMLKDSIKKNIDVVKVYREDVEGKQKDEFKDFGLEIFLDLSEARAKVVGLGFYDEVYGKLWLVKALGGSVGLDGKIEHRRGWYEFNKTKIEISEGYAIFKKTLDPDLFLVATKKVGDIEITVHVMGKGSEPEIVMTSDPPMDKIDIVSYLLFNRPATSLTGSEGLALQTQVAVFLGSQASQILKKAIGDTPFTPDVIQMRENSSGQTSVLEIGKYITPDFYVTYEKDLRSSSGDAVKMEYRLNRRFSVQTQIGSQNQSGVDLLWRYDFGK